MLRQANTDLMTLCEEHDTAHERKRMEMQQFRRASLRLAEIELFVCPSCRSLHQGEVVHGDVYRVLSTCSFERDAVRLPPLDRSVKV